MGSHKNKVETEGIHQRIRETYVYRNIQLSKLRRRAIESIS